MTRAVAMALGATLGKTFGVACRRGRGASGMARGYTLVELLVAAVVGGLVSTAAVVTGARVRRAAAEQAERVQARAQLAQAAAVLGTELGGVATGSAPEGADVVEASDSVLEVRATVGGGVACTVGAGAGGGSVLDVGASGAGVGWWEATPGAADVVLVHDPGVDPGAGDDVWHARAATGATTGAGVCAGSPFVMGGGAPSWRLALAPPALPATVGMGAPVRVLRRRRYALYRAGDGLWYLGMREWDAGGWNGVQPLAGPFDALGDGGMRVVVQDRAGAVRAAGAPMPVGAEIDVRFRASRRRGMASWRDSARVVVRTAGDGGAPWAP